MVRVREGGSAYLNEIDGRVTGRGVYVMRAGRYGEMDPSDVQTRSVQTLVSDVEPARHKGLIGATDIAEELRSRDLVGSEAGATPHDRLYGRADGARPGAPGAGSLAPMAIDQIGRAHV